jgi:intracellular sulfur oxidation DsrE/DsrF family protein
MASEERDRILPGVVVQFNEAERDRQEATVRDVRHLRADVGPEVPIELVLTGPAVRLAIEGDGLLRDARDAGITVVVCADSLRGQGALAADLAEVTVVAAGAGHLVRRQAQGWAYLRL